MQTQRGEPGGPGISLSRVLALGRLPPAAAVLTCVDVLDALASLHRRGQAHGRLTAILVRVGDGGGVVVDPPPFHGDVPATASEIGADARAGGELVCQVLGVPTRRPSGGAPDPAEAYFPRLIQIGRAMVDGSAGTDVGRLSGEFRDAAGTWLQEDRVEIGRALLARAAARAERGLPVREAQHLDREPGPEPGRGPVIRNWLAEPRRAFPPEIDRSVWMAIAVLVVILIAGIYAGPRLVRKLQGGSTAAVAVHPSGAPSTAASSPPAGSGPTSKPQPSLPPPAAGVIRSVELAPQSPCTPGGTCTIEVTVRFAPAPAPQDVSWTVRAIDGCTGTVTELPGSHVNAQAGWTSVIGDSNLSLPAARKVSLVAVTTAPDAASSPPVPAGSGAC